MRKIIPSLRFPALALALLLGLGLAGGHSSAWARPGEHYRQEQRQTISPSRAAALAKERYGGKVLKVQRQQSGQRLTYRVKLLLDSGHVRQVTVDATTGAIRGR